MLNIGDKVTVNIPAKKMPKWYGIFEIRERCTKPQYWVIGRIVNEPTYTDHTAYILNGTNYLFDKKWLKPYMV